MKKLFGILFLFTLLTSCADPVARYQNFMGDPENALVATAYDGFGIGVGEATIEHAVYAAFRTCEHYNPNDTCILKQINGRVVSYSEAREWRVKYNKNSMYLSYGFSNGGYSIINDTGKRHKETQTTQTTQTTQATQATQTTQTTQTETTKPEKNVEEKTLEETLLDIFGDRELDKIEGLWGYTREGEKEPRVYLMVRSEDYLYEEIVISHPVKAFQDDISTRIVEKINNNSYKVKGTWLNKNKKKWKRDGKITLIDKFKIKFEYKETCYADDDCFKEHVYYKQKVWPPETYSESLDLTEEETEKLKSIMIND
tara:strand:+ start:339 stop:1277 length:939 start_codon:yes stop_codon:yes gene_type:complete